MANYQEILSKVRLLLGEPHPEAPSEAVVWEHLSNNAQLLFNMMLNTPINWNTGYTDLIVLPDIDSYLITAADFGKDTLVETYDATEVNYVRRPVTRMSLQSQPYGEGVVYRDNYGPDGVKHAARSFAFYRDNGVIKVRVDGKHTQAATYRIWYERATANTDSLGNQTLIPLQASLLAISTALSCLPATKWSGLTMDENSRQRKEYAMALASDKADQMKEYRRYIATDRQAGLTRMRGFDDSEYEMEY